MLVEDAVRIRDGSPRLHGRGCIEAASAKTIIFAKRLVLHVYMDVAALKRRPSPGRRRRCPGSPRLHGRGCIEAIRRTLRNRRSSCSPRLHGRGCIEARSSSTGNCLTHSSPRLHGRGCIEARPSFFSFLFLRGSPRLHGRGCIEANSWRSIIWRAAAVLHVYMDVAALKLGSRQLPGPVRPLVLHVYMDVAALKHACRHRPGFRGRRSPRLHGRGCIEAPSSCRRWWAS